MKIHCPWCDYGSRIQTLETVYGVEYTPYIEGKVYFLTPNECDIQIDKVPWEDVELLMVGENQRATPAPEGAVTVGIPTPSEYYNDQALAIALYERFLWQHNSQ
ncbi:MAG: hypothetical protein GTO49_17170 [Anaerolineae bacterium]|nr:hypothetical protein [Anaerolineae bacterium]